jgi:pimeloyl-ACP methyl ester carboxylesterase
MNKLISFALALAGIVVLAGCQTHSPAPSTKPAEASKAFTFVIVHGAWGGGWDWKPVADLLTADGNTVYRPTLTGLGEHVNLDSTNIDLDTHIQDIVNVILWENLHDVVLVGHSYGGMVVTGVADRVPGRIRRVIYLDAILPENGESVVEVMDHTNRYRIVNGFVPPLWVKPGAPPPHDVSMPLRTFTEPITLTNQATAEKLPATYILTVDAGTPPEQDDFYKFYRRAQNRSWPTLVMEGDHNVQRSHPKELADLLEQAARGDR